MPHVDLDALLKRVSLVDMVQRWDQVVVKGGAEKVGPCPGCKGKDRFHIHAYNNRDYWFCRQCHETRSDAFGYLDFYHHMPFREALEELIKQAGMVSAAIATEPRKQDAAQDVSGKPPTDALIERLHTALMCNGRALKFLQDRYGLDESQAELYGLGYIDNHWGSRGEGIVIPVYVDNRIMTARVRSMSAEADWRYLPWSTHCGAWPFNVDTLAGGLDRLVICEGEFKAMTVSKYIPAIGLPGVDNFVPRVTEQDNEAFEAAWFQRFLCAKEIFIVLDEGQDALWRPVTNPKTKQRDGLRPRAWVHKLIASGANVRVINLPMKPDDLILSLGSDAFLDALTSARRASTAQLGVMKCSK